MGGEKNSNKSWSIHTYHVFHHTVGTQEVWFLELPVPVAVGEEEHCPHVAAEARLPHPLGHS